MVSAVFCFRGETETRGRKRSRLKGLNVGKKAKRGQKVLCQGQKCPRKGGEWKESHYWPDPQTHCKQRGVQPGMTDVPGHCFPCSLLSASCSDFGNSTRWPRPDQVVQRAPHVAQHSWTPSVKFPGTCQRSWSELWDLSCGQTWPGPPWPRVQKQSSKCCAPQGNSLVQPQRPQHVTWARNQY